MTDDHTFMTIAERANPVPVHAYAGLRDSTEGVAVLAAILETDSAVAAGSTARVRGPRRPHRIGRRIAAAAVVAAVAVAAVVAFEPSGDPGGDPHLGWDATLVRIAEQSPRLLLGEDGWSVTRAGEFTPMTGEMIFENGRHEVSLFWTPAETYENSVEDRRREASASWTITIAGENATLFRRRGVTAMGTPSFSALWIEGVHALELRSDILPRADEFEAVAATLHHVDVDSWLSAMPTSVVRPDAREDAVDRIVAGIPLPDNVDIEQLKAAGTVSAESSLNYEVTQAIVCGWIQQWVDATRSGDEVARQEAVAAMAGARDWRAFRERSQGTTYIFEVADAMKTGSPLYEDSSLPVGVQYQRHVGCAEG